MISMLRCPVPTMAATTPQRMGCTGFDSRAGFSRSSRVSQVCEWRVFYSNNTSPRPAGLATPGFAYYEHTY